MAKKAPIAIPTLLSEAVKTKRAVLFLGAGASKEGAQVDLLAASHGGCGACR